jgi:hypothetical protein
MLAAYIGWSELRMCQHSMQPRTFHYNSVNHYNSRWRTFYFNQLITMKKLTIGMAVWQDPKGVWATIQNLRAAHLFQQSRLEQVEFLVVDNNPTSSESMTTQNFCHSIGARYVPYDVRGTSPSRDKVFAESRTPWTMCVDSHLQFGPTFLETALRTIDLNSDNSKNLFQGVLWFDGLSHLATHMNDVWSDQMWGKWGLAWSCKCRKFRFSVVESPELPYQAECRELVSQEPVRKCPQCQKALSMIPYSGHEKTLLDGGCQPLNLHPNEDPFEIPAHGLGMFMCPTDQWLGFHPEARGFGGEEVWYHEKVRANGGRVMCVPGLDWVHYFGPKEQPYPLRLWEKVRNYVLEFNAVGRSLHPIWLHFVSEGHFMDQTRWDYLLESPETRTEWPSDITIAPPQLGGCCVVGNPMEGVDTIEDCFDRVAETPRDLNEHMTELRRLASMCDFVTDVSIRKESLIAFLASEAKQVTTYCPEISDPWVKHALSLSPGKKVVHNFPSGVGSIEPTDMLFLNTIHTFQRLSAELLAYAPNVRRFIVIHNSTVFRDIGEDGKPPGLLEAIRLYCRAHPEWGVVSHTDDQHGLTVLSRDPRDKKPLPSTIQMAASLASSLVGYVASGLASASAELVEARLNVCSLCPQRNDVRCGMCGCFLAEKAKIKNADCPLALWPLDESIST